MFTGYNDASSQITLTPTDLTAGDKVVRSSVLHTMDVDGFIGIDIIDVGFGLDQEAPSTRWTSVSFAGTAIAWD